MVATLHVSLRSRDPLKRLRRGRGFTLIELLTVVLVIAVLAAIGTPSFNGIILNSRVRTATFDVYSSLAFARSEALKRNREVEVVPVLGDWENGWTVKLSDAPATVLRNQDAIPAPINFCGPLGASLTFRRDGRLAAVIPKACPFSTTYSTFSLSVSGNSQVTMRCIKVDVSGQPNIRVDNNGDGDCTNG